MAQERPNESSLQSWLIKLTRRQSLMPHSNQREPKVHMMGAWHLGPNMWSRPMSLPRKKLLSQHRSENKITRNRPFCLKRSSSSCHSRTLGRHSVRETKTYCGSFCAASWLLSPRRHTSTAGRSKLKIRNQLYRHLSTSMPLSDSIACHLSLSSQ